MKEISKIIREFEKLPYKIYGRRKRPKHDTTENLSNGTLPIVTRMMDTRIDDRIDTCGGTTHTLATPTTKEVMTDAACRSARINRTPRNVIRMGRDNSNLGNCDLAVSLPQDN